MPPEQRRNALWIALFIFLAAGLAVPYLFVTEPPLLDYANHLARAFVLDHLHDPGYQFAQYYRADWKPYPYVLWDLLALALQRILPVEIAGKLLLMLTTVLLPFSVAWFLWQANRGSIRLSLLACALSYNVLFFWGFTAYHLSVGFCFLMVGTWLWYRRRPSRSRAALFVLVMFLTYFAHLLGFAAAAFILVFYELTSLQWREWLRLACFLAPPSLLFLWARPGLSGQNSRLEWRPILDKMQALRNLTTQGYDPHLDQDLSVRPRALFALGGGGQSRASRQLALAAGPVGFFRGLSVTAVWMGSQLGSGCAAGGAALPVDARCFAGGTPRQLDCRTRRGADPAACLQHHHGLPG